MITIEPLSNNALRVKAINLELIRQTMRRLKQATKSDLAQVTGLSVATCGNMLKELLAAGEIIEAEPEASSGGRPARKFIYNADYALIACLFIRLTGGVRTLDYIVVNAHGEPVDSGCEESVMLDAAVVDRRIGTLIEAYPQIRAAGIGLPGFTHQGTVNVCDIPELIGAPLEHALREKYGIPIVVENDMNMTVYGFSRDRGIEDDRTVAVATFIQGSYPGAGIFTGGRVLEGKSRFAGELSFLPLGLTREEQMRQLGRKKTFPPLAARMLSSLIAVINPDLIALTGDQAGGEDLDLIRTHCLNSIPAEHMPELELLKDPDSFYRSGLTAATMEQLNLSLQLVQVRR